MDQDKPKPRADQSRLGIRLDDDLRVRLNVIVKRRKTSVQAIVEQFLQRYVEDAEAGQPVPLDTQEHLTIESMARSVLNRPAPAAGRHGEQRPVYGIPKGAQVGGKRDRLSEEAGVYAVGGA